MAPEQIRGEPADRRSDIFAFGILLCEMVSGNNPFKRTSIDATFAAILHDPVATLHNHRPPIPAALDPLATRLLANEPAARFQSFGDVRSAIRKISADLSSSTSRLSAAIDGTTNDGDNTLIGRDRERAQLLQIFNEATSGCGGVVLLYGDVGVGKTRLAEEALALARRRGYQTLVGRCHEQQDTPALIAYTEVLEDASRLMPAASFQQAIKASAPELAKLMPELRRLFPDVAPPMALPPELRQRYLFTNVREFLTRSSRFMRRLSRRRSINSSPNDRPALSSCVRSRTPRYRVRSPRSASRTRQHGSYRSSPIARAETHSSSSSCSGT